MPELTCKIDNLQVHLDGLRTDDSLLSDCDRPVALPQYVQCACVRHGVFFTKRLAELWVCACC